MGKYKNIKIRLQQGYVKMRKQRKMQQILLALFFFTCIFAILITSLRPEKLNLTVGQRTPADIYSPKEIEDKWETERLKEIAVEGVELKYKQDPSYHHEVKKDVEKFFVFLYKVRESEGMSKSERKTALSDNELNISGDVLDIALNAPIEKLEYLENYIYQIVAQNMSNGIKIEDLQKEKSNIRAFIESLEDFDDGLVDLGTAIINATIRPNKFLDIEATEQKRQEVRESVERVMIRKGDIILREGEVVTADRMSLLKDLGLLTTNSKLDIMLYAGIALLVLVLELIVIAYITVFNKELLNKVGILWMIALIFVSVTIISKVLSSISIFLMPVAAAAMLWAILTDARLSLILNLALILLVSVITGNDITFIFMALVGGTVGIFSVLNTQQRGSIFISGFMVSLAQVMTVMGFGLINSSEVAGVLAIAFYGILNGLFCAILTVGSLPLWESVFDVVTPLKLLELSNPNHPLLKKLLIEAPGTYHHSIIVGNLSEAATGAVGGNALLARTGAFYHDVGKTSRPYFFKENQLTSENPHDKISPSLSSIIITSHVKDGLELAKKYKLPQEIANFIDQHHGNTLVAYFYHKAKNGDNGDMMEEESFRYKGLKPQTKETAIVMLADSVEAAVRSLSAPNKEKIEKMISKIIKDKLEDDQLEESNLTLGELEKIKQAFVKVILGIFHERIEYPDLDIKEVKGRRAHESNN
ncbi:HD family phosphohydrolase [Alkaliphilus hydrothermalis]|uniref:Nucleotidyltransferase with HDIG domain n=1 Tax=Alkaliphilus hydrothermalis TaxID=1482730 RepID=A0ABS2NP60_9FIRM|nr:HDIG domain-containing metalloprotein [Alkaliphilus hydrothermalis]MBM7614646.1 putative nucleotidyltransferase with HDIG domain [Alkaliphilus hydrothermalis]